MSLELEPTLAYLYQVIYIMPVRYKHTSSVVVTSTIAPCNNPVLVDASVLLP